MNSFFHNRYIKFAASGLVVIFAFIILVSIFASLSSSRSGFDGYMKYAPSVSQNSTSEGRAIMTDDTAGKMIAGEQNYYPPEPAPSEYTADLESFETTSYSVTARTRDFDPLCAELENLKADEAIHFKYLNTAINNCRATFYVEESKVDATIDIFSSFAGIEISRNTESVTRHRQQLQSQTEILQQQLASVQRSLTSAEIQFDELADFARQSKDAASLSEAIRYKLQNIDTLTQRKINLTNQLNRLYQQAADLKDRLDVVQFDVSINRSYPIYSERDSQKWESAWEELKDAYTDTLINLSAFFGVFLLWGVQTVIYLLVSIVILRGLWKFVKLLWNRW